MTTEERLAKVERELADLRAELAAGIITRQVEIVDVAGEARMMLTVDADGLPMLSLHDEAGVHRALLYVQSGGGSVLALNDAARKGSTVLSMIAGVPALGLFDPEGKGSAGLSIDADGPRLLLRDAAGKMIWSAP